MRINDAAEAATSMVRQVKEDAVRRHKGRVDLETTIVCYRGDELAAMITHPPHRDEMLKVCFLAANGFAADVLAVTHDSYSVDGPAEDVRLDPRTGKHWANPVDGPGGMQTYVEEYGFDGLVKEALMTHVLNRAGDSKVINQPYRVDGRTVTWLESPDREGSKIFGGVPDALKRCMDHATFNQMVPPEAFALVDHDPDRIRFHTDMATLFVIEEKTEIPATVTLFAEKGSPREQLFRTRLARSRIMDPRRWN